MTIGDKWIDENGNEFIVTDVNINDIGDIVAIESIGIL